MKYSYKAKDGPGKTIEGELYADTRAGALAQIDAMGFSPILVQETDLFQTDDKGSKIISCRGIRKRDITVFTRQLASLTKSGVPILKALSTLAEQSENSRLAKVVNDLENTVRDGNMLSDALARYPRLFPELYINMIRAGESGGVIDVVLFRMADAREKEEETARKVQAAVAYPILIIAVGVITVFVLLSFFLPRVVQLFGDNYENLPLPTRILITITGFFENYWYWLILVAGLAASVVKGLASIEGGRIFFHRIYLHLPFIGKFICQAEIARFARTLSLLIDSGVPIDRALLLSANTFRNYVLRNEITQVREKTVQQGASFSSGLKGARYFPLLVANMSAVGEEAGRLDESLSEVAEYYERELNQQSKLATSLLEPILILVVGAIVGFIVAAMLLPVFSLGNAL